MALETIDAARFVSLALSVPKIANAITMGKHKNPKIIPLKSEGDRNAITTKATTTLFAKSHAMILKTIDALSFVSLALRVKKIANAITIGKFQ
jgi:hypothetical protein